MSSMLDSMMDITSRYASTARAAENNSETSSSSSVRTLEEMRAAQNAKKDGSSNSTLSFEDMLLLMVTQLQNQTIDNQADPNDMMNQLIQMTVMQALTEVSTQVDQLTEANILNYSASLVGKGSQIIQDIDMVGTDMEMGQGMCGSSSGSVPTNVGQPLIRVSPITVGGR